MMWLQAVLILSGMFIGAAIVCGFVVFAIYKLMSLEE